MEGHADSGAYLGEVHQVGCASGWGKWHWQEDLEDAKSG